MEKKPNQDPGTVLAVDLIDTAVRTFSEEALLNLDAHPPVEEIVAYNEGKLEAEAQDGLREHLTLCDECSELLLDLVRFPQIETQGGEPHPSDEGTAAETGGLKARTEDHVEAGRVVNSSTLPKVRIPAWYHAVAASLLVALGLSLWMASHPPSAPRANTDVFYLEPGIFRGADSPSHEVPLSSQEYLLVLASYEPEPHPSYRLEILDPDGGLVWSTDDLQKTHDNTFTLTLPREFLAEGRYKIQLFGVRDASFRLLDSYELRLDLH